MGAKTRIARLERMIPDSSPPVDIDEAAGWTPKQQVAVDTADTHRFTLYGGSRGPGKSYWLRWYLLRELLRMREMGITNPQVGLFCESYPVLRDRQISKIRIEFPKALGRVRSTQDAGLGFHLYGGGVLALRNLDDPSKYQSAEWAAVGVDELTKNTKETFDILRGSLRWPGLERPKFVAATNPGGIGHLWCKDLWVDGIYPPELERMADEFAFVRALPDDNPHLPPSYWDELETLPPPLARAWRWGDWDVFQGQYFGEFRRDLHVVQPFEIPADVPRWRAVDWGFHAPFCCVWVAYMPVQLEGFSPELKRKVVYREVYRPELTDPEQAEAIVRATAKDEKIGVTLADPSMWTRRTLERQTVTTADVYRKNGVILKEADNDRLIGWRRVRDALMPMEDGKPGLLIFETCTNLMRTLPALVYDQVRVEDVDSNGEDHAADALRYALAWKVRGPRRAPDTVKDYWGGARTGSLRRPSD